jgi:predicted enzyme related to lactoylglutathione lyase
MRSLKGVSNPMDVSLITYPADDLEGAKRFFRELTGTEPYAESPHYVGFKSGEMEIGLVPKGHGERPIPFWTVDDIAASIKALVDAGGAIVQETRNVGYGLLVATLKDPNGSIVGLRQFPKG